MTSPDLPMRFDADGLIPAVIQDAASDDVLMVGFMNDEALAATRATGKVHFWSRSRAKLWRKGETSGHEQLVDEIFVNCERNSLLVTVRQIGAVCHDGYPTCFYRRLEDDGALTIVRERAFDPAAVYVDGASGLVAITRLWFGAYEFLSQHDLADVSRTSRLLRSGSVAPHRIAEELVELAGVLDGTHTHAGGERDAMLEGSQVLYWSALNAVALGFTWDDVRPDRALVTAEPGLAAAASARLLQGEAGRWEADPHITPQRLHAVIAQVAQAVLAAGITPGRLIEADLADMRGRAYLAPYFARAESD